METFTDLRRHKQMFVVFSENANRRQTFVFSATLTFVPTKPQRLKFAKKKKKKFHQITTKEKLGQFCCLLLTYLFIYLFITNIVQ